MDRRRAPAIGLAALTHVGTASIAVPTGLAIGLLSATRAAPTWRGRLRRLAPLVASLAVVGVYWLVFLLPGGTEFATEPGEPRLSRARAACSKG